MKKNKILFVDDDPKILTVIASVLEHRGYHVTTASGGEAAIDALCMKDFDLVITDLNMPEIDGIAVVKKAKELNRDRGVMILTGSHDAALITEALRVGADDYVLKPCKMTELWRRVDNCLERSEVRRKEVSSWHQISESPFTETATTWT
ncbi:MAG: response regulator [Deltaproteobacteria bacterium]|nr:response regulator [Deltaproteobacteria bacterium]MBW1793610.1 response regulator [Deltaproteobacteria bacterium]MBW2329990.1 response regulator [Deltaproteobacteria bacterium]